MERRIESLRRTLDPLTSTAFALDQGGLQRLIRYVGDTVSSACKDKSQRLKKRAGQRLHAALLARVNFKIAFFAEMRGDFPGAVKYVRCLDCWLARWWSRLFVYCLRSSWLYSLIRFSSI